MHSLENGLGIYKLRLLASDPHVTAAIAGPHHTFDAIRKRTGNTEATMETLTKGLDHWKLFDPPPIRGLQLQSNIYPTPGTTPNDITSLPEENRQHFLPVPRKPQIPSRKARNGQEGTNDQHNPLLYLRPLETPEQWLYVPNSWKLS